VEGREGTGLTSDDPFSACASKALRSSLALLSSTSFALFSSNSFLTLSAILYIVYAGDIMSRYKDDHLTRLFIVRSIFGVTWSDQLD
jgi:hypothetical protein